MPLLTQSIYIKIIYSRNFRCSAKEAILLLLLWSTLCLEISISVASWFYFFLFQFPTFNPKYMGKSEFFLKFQVPRMASSFMGSFVEYTVCSNFKMYGLLILVYPECMYKSHLFLKFQVLRKGSSFITPSVEHPVCSNFKKFLDSSFFYFNLSQLIQSPSVKENSSWNCKCSAKESSITSLLVEHPVCSIFIK